MNELKLEQKIKELKKFIEQKTDLATANYLVLEIRDICGMVETINVKTGVHEPYLKIEKDHQLVKMEELGINTTSQTFEQCVNSVICMLKELKQQ